MKVREKDEEWGVWGRSEGKTTFTKCIRQVMEFWYNLHPFLYCTARFTCSTNRVFNFPPYFPLIINHSLLKSNSDLQENNGHFRTKVKQLGNGGVEIFGPIRINEGSITLIENPITYTPFVVLDLSYPWFQVDRRLYPHVSDCISFVVRTHRWCRTNRVTRGRQRKRDWV